MNDANIDDLIRKRREYHRKWRAEHPESVRAAQERYWTKKIAKLNKAAAIPDNVEIRSAEEA